VVIWILKNIARGLEGMARSVQNSQMVITERKQLVVLGDLAFESRIRVWTEDDLSMGVLGKIEVARDEVCVVMSLQNPLDMKVLLRNEVGIGLDVSQRINKGNLFAALNEISVLRKTASLELLDLDVWLVDNQCHTLF